MDRFLALYSGTYRFDKRQSRALHGVRSHFEKAILLRGLLEQLAPTLEVDKTELHKTGSTQAMNGRQWAAVFESTILELYSSLDCAHKVLHAIYPNTRGFRDSTSSLFTSILKNPESSNLPHPIVETIAQCTWFPALLAHRSELVHFDVGHCSLSAEGSISYMHGGLGSSTRALVIEDAFKYLTDIIQNVNWFLGSLFAILNKTFKEDEINQFCGIFGGRIYSRNVNPKEVHDFDSGVCTSFQWFDLPDNPTCIFAGTCGAYKRAKNN